MKSINLTDYKNPDYIVPNVDIYVDIHEKDVFVESTLTIIRKGAEGSPLILNGKDLTIESIKIDGITVKSYTYENELLTINNLPENFELFTRVKIDPYNNKSLEGFYKSGDILCSQNEAEGFRRITFFPDRPDIMSIFSITLEGDSKKYPFLLSNGNLIESKELGNGRVKNRWEDPFAKPCYLVALVAGDLELVKDTYTTVSGRNISLEIYTDPGKSSQCGHAMKSLKKSMKWDEEVFGLEYDLDIYMIVAVDSFNAGAMENKGLNIFNSVYVLADPATATDHDFEGVEGVIAHEYFHNWTGNRVTCRDWFQLTLKEGLTVFRDQEFSSDMTDRTVKRISDVSLLRSYQFAEERGPNAHPIKPASYIEIDNFYSVTVYEKGAEVIRMIHTLIGKENFRAGMDLYFKRHDGQAVTTEDFVNSMEDASGHNLNQFKLWYSQAGTPVVDVESNYKNGVYSLTLKQHIPETAYKGNNEPMYFPFNIGLFSDDGTDYTPQDKKQLILSKKEETFTFDTGINVIPSLLQGYSAPVIVNYNYSIKDLIILLKSDTDNFNRFDAARRVTTASIENILNERVIDDEIIEAYKTLLTDKTIDKRYLATLIYLPEIKDIVATMKEYDYTAASNARTKYITTLATQLKGELFRIFEDNVADKYLDGKKAVAERCLKNKALSILSYLGDDIAEISLKQFSSADNMTDYIAAFYALQKCSKEIRERANLEFLNKWKDNFLVMNKWFAAQALRSDNEVLDDVKTLSTNKLFDKTNPNRIRSLFGAFASGNSAQFHRPDGEGYQYIADKIIEIDSYNSHASSGMAKTFQTYKYLPVEQKRLMEIQLNKIVDSKDISPGLYEIITKTLNAGK